MTVSHHNVKCAFDVLQKGEQFFRVIWNPCDYQDMAFSRGSTEAKPRHLDRHLKSTASESFPAAHEE